MKKFKIVFGIICIVASILLLLYPYINNSAEEEYYANEKDVLLDEIDDLMSNLEEKLPTDDNELDYVLPSIPTETHPTIETLPTIPTEATTPTEPPYVPYRTSTNEEVDGILYIPAIDLELPILTNVTEKGLKKTCARVTNTDPPGAKNYCIMGHTNRNYGRIFNRLHEVKVGDVIRVKARNYTYVYKVYEVFRTEGLDMKILEDVDEKQIITVFCCSYHVTNGRLVVRGELTSVIQTS